MGGFETAEHVRARIVALGNPERALGAQRYFKTGPGEYGEGDVFVGVRVPELRKLAREYRSLPVSDAVRLLHDPVHEVRLFALLMMVQSFSQAVPSKQERICQLYLKHTRFINNWDLVDVSAEHIVGAYLMGRDQTPLDTLARSSLIWERRIAIVSTFFFIRRKNYALTIRIAEILLNDSEDLIHKAVGWLLREVGKRDRTELERFLKKNGVRMPRTMLRYAIERFPEPQRKQYLRTMA